MVDYVRLAEAARNLLISNGRTIQFVKISRTPANADKPWNGPSNGTETLISLSGVFIPTNSVQQFGLAALGLGAAFKDLMAMSEQLIIVSPGSYDLREYSSVIDQNVRWGILGVQILQPGTVKLLAYVGVKR